VSRMCASASRQLTQGSYFDGSCGTLVRTGLVSSDVSESLERRDPLAELTLLFVPVPVISRYVFGKRFDAVCQIADLM